MARGLLLLSCNGFVRLGDYMLGRNWRLVYSYVRDLVEAGLLELGAVDSCKPGIVLRGEEGEYRWCDRSPRWEVYRRDPQRFHLLVDGVARDLRELAVRFGFIASYIEVKVYRAAVKAASRAVGVRVLDLGPPMPTPLSLASRRNREALRQGLLRAFAEDGHRI